MPGFVTTVARGARVAPSVRPGLGHWVWFGAPAGWSVTVLLALVSNEACAAALGSLTTSVGLFAALAALLVVKTLPGDVAMAALPAVAGVLLFIGAVAWLWRVRATQQRIGAAEPPVRLSRNAPATALVGSVRQPALALPAGIESTALLAELRLQFVRTQAAWDLREMHSLRLLTTPAMLDELCFDWPGNKPAGGADRTDVVTLHAQLLGYEDVATGYVVSVEFSGLIREAAGQSAHPFREVWMFARSKRGGTDWKLARHQALL